VHTWIAVKPTDAIEFTVYEVIGFEKLQLIPLLVITPLVFLGGSVYSVNMLLPFWQTVTLFNPVLYLVSVAVWWVFKTRYRVKR